MDAAEIERLLDAPAKRGASTADLTGPVTVLGSAGGPDGVTRVDISASRLVAVDPDDPALADVCIPLPVPATVVVDDAGHLASVARGRKVIRRIGFATTLDPQVQHGPTSQHETGGTDDG